MESRGRLGLLSNRRAGLHGGSLAALTPLLAHAPEVVHIVTESQDQLSDALARFAERDVRVLAVNGGDGSLQRVLTEILCRPFFDRLPAIAPLSGGRTNMSAADIGGASTPAVGLTALLRAWRSNALSERMVTRPVLRLDAEPGLGERYGLFFGSGVIQRALAFKHGLYPRRRLQGLFGAGLFLAGAVLAVARGPRTGMFGPDDIGLTFDDAGDSAGHGERQPFQLIMATTLTRLLLRVRPFWGREDAPLRCTTISARAIRSPRAVWRIVRGLPPSAGPDSGYDSRNVERLSLRMDCGFTIDGELFDPRPDRVLRLSTDRRVQFVRA